MPGRRPGKESPHHSFALPFLDIQGLHLTLEAIHHNASPAPFFFPGGEDSFIFQPGPSWGQERKRTPHFHQEGRQAGGWGGKRSERSQTASLPPTSAPRSAGSDRAHRWRPGNSVPLREQWLPEEEEGRTAAPDSAPLAPGEGAKAKSHRRYLRRPQPSPTPAPPARAGLPRRLLNPSSLTGKEVGRKRNRRFLKNK